MTGTRRRQRTRRTAKGFVPKNSVRFTSGYFQLHGMGLEGEGGGGGGGILADLTEFKMSQGLYTYLAHFSLCIQVSYKKK
jgi:hypothetical protein